MHDSKTTGEQSHSGRTIGLAVGLGVGIPCFVTVLVLTWVTIRHNRKMREEDEEHKDIDFNGDISFFSPGRKLRDSEDSQFQTNDETESSAVQSDNEMRMGIANMSNMIYTPELGLANHSQETFSRTLNSVYGPSPVYPSTEKLKGPQFSQVSGSSASIRSGNTLGSSYIGGAGPFATPPRRSSHPYSQYNDNRRASASSIPSMPGVPLAISNNSVVDDARTQNQGYHTMSNATPLASGQQSQLHQLNEVPHPYLDLVGNESHQSISKSAAEMSREGSVFKEAREYPPEAQQSSHHPYHAEARNRESTFEFQNN